MPLAQIALIINRLVYLGRVEMAMASCQQTRSFNVFQYL